MVPLVLIVTAPASITLESDKVSAGASRTGFPAREFLRFELFFEFNSLNFQFGKILKHFCLLKPYVSAAGNSIQNRLPPFGTDSTPHRPPICRVALATMARPMPVPL
jgi:hypothetical protein